MADAIYVTWRELLTLLEHLSSPTVFLVGIVPVLLSAFVFCVVLLCVFLFRVRIKTMLPLSLPTIVLGRFMSYLRCLCLFAYTGSSVQHILLCFCFVFLRLVYPMLPVSLNCRYTFLIAPSVLSDIYGGG